MALRTRARQVAIIGLGRFGRSLCSSFVKEDVEVLAIDRDERSVAAVADLVTHAVRADTTDERVLRDLGIDEFDHVVVAIGEDIQSSILTALLLKEVGAREIWAKAQNDYHARVLELVGVSHVVQPERDMGERLAHLIASASLLDFIELSGDYHMVEIEASRYMYGHSLRELDVRARFGCNVVGVRRGTDMDISPSPDDVILEGDALFVLGRSEDIERLAAGKPARRR